MSWRIEARERGMPCVLNCGRHAGSEKPRRYSSSIHGEIEVRGEIEARLSFQEEKRQANTESVVREAAAEVGEKQVQAHDVDHDWTARFFAEVQDVSSEKMQQIWAKILAGEVETPGRTPCSKVDIGKHVRGEAELLSGSPFSHYRFLY